MRALLACLLLLSCGAAAHAGPVEDAMLEHIDWITANSSFEYAGEELPEVRYVSQEVLDDLGGNSAGTTRAVYHHFVNAIYLPEGTDPLSWGAQPTLVHEMVHYLQWVRGTLRGEVCIGRFEPPAYAIMDIWVAEHGHPSPRSDPKTVLSMALECRERGK